MVQAFNLRLKYLCVKRLQFLFLVLLNLWIIVEHSTNFCGVDRLRLVQVTSIETLQLWLMLFNWMRIFPQTAIWVMMIWETLWDILPFMTLVVMTIASFGNAIFVLDHY